MKRRARDSRVISSFEATVSQPPPPKHKSLGALPNLSYGQLRFLAHTSLPLRCRCTNPPGEFAISKSLTVSGPMLP